MLKTKILILSFLILLMSCKSQEKTIENSLRKCVNKSIGNQIRRISNKNINFYQLIIKVENILLNDGLLANNNSKSYSDLFKNILKDKYPNEHKEAYNKIYFLLDRSGYENNGYLVKSDVLKDCPYRILITERNKYDTFLSEQVRIISQLEDKGFNNKKLILELVNIINDKSFTKVIYRAPIILLVYRNLKMKYGDWSQKKYYYR